MFITYETAWSSGAVAIHSAAMVKIARVPPACPPTNAEAVPKAMSDSTGHLEEVTRNIVSESVVQGKTT